METIKILIIGVPGVGKTSLLFRKSLQQIVITYPTIGFIVQNIKVNKKIINVWEVSGGDKIRPLIRWYLEAVKVIIFMYDITGRESFDELYDEFLINCREKDPKTKMILVGNKCELETLRKVSYDEGLTFANLHNMLFFETSVENNINIDAIFTWIAHFG